MAIDIDDAGIIEIFPEIEEIKDPVLRRGVIDIWKEVGQECKWERFEDIPKNAELERDRRLTDHTRGVTRMALALADIGESQHGMKYHRDNLLAACILHDVSKALEIDPDPEGKATNGPARPAKKSELGDKIQHGAYGMHKVFAHKLPLDVAHLVLTHTHSSNMRSKSIEGSYLFYADMADSDIGAVAADSIPYTTRYKLAH